MATGIERTATPTRVGRERKWEVEATQQEHPEEVGANRWWGEEGQATNGKPERGPPWERSNARSGGRQPQRTRTRHVANLRKETGSIHVESLEDRMGTSQGSFRPHWRREPTHNQLITASCSGNEMAMARNLGERTNHLIGDGRVSLMDHSKTVTQLAQ